jgi:hypothetical protein
MLRRYQSKSACGKENKRLIFPRSTSARTTCSTARCSRWHHHSNALLIRSLLNSRSNGSGIFSPLFNCSIDINVGESLISVAPGAGRQPGRIAAYTNAHQSNSGRSVGFVIIRDDGKRQIPPHLPPPRADAFGAINSSSRSSGPLAPPTQRATIKSHPHCGRVASDLAMAGTSRQGETRPR